MSRKLTAAENHLTRRIGLLEKAVKAMNEELSLLMSSKEGDEVSEEEDEVTMEEREQVAELEKCKKWASRLKRRVVHAEGEQEGVRLAIEFMLRCRGYRRDWA